MKMYNSDMFIVKDCFWADGNYTEDSDSKNESYTDTNTTFVNRP